MKETTKRHKWYKFQLFSCSQGLKQNTTTAMSAEVAMRITEITSSQNHIKLTSGSLHLTRLSSKWRTNITP